MRRIQSTIALFCVWMMATPSILAQQPSTSADQGHTWFNFGNMSKWYQASLVAPVSVSNSARLESLVRAGKLYLSLQDAIAAALENNIDLEVQRYTPRLAETDVMRAKAGALLRGFGTGVSSGAVSAAGARARRRRPRASGAG